MFTRAHHEVLQGLTSTVGRGASSASGLGRFIAREKKSRVAA